MIEIIWSELTSGLPDTTELAHVVVRLLAAIALGAVVGYEREQAGKSAGLRTHILVAMGTTLFVLAAAGSGMTSDGVSRVIQGLTTAAGIWVTAAIGVTVGLGGLGLALLGTIFTWIVLVSIGIFERRLELERDKKIGPNNT